LLAERGACVIDADRVGHEVYLPGTPGFDRIVAEFGSDVVAADGYIDRAALGKRIFADKSARQRLNRIVHPLIGDEIMSRLAVMRKENESAPVVIEAPLLDASWRKLVTVVWVVVASRDAIVDRLRRGRGLEAGEVDARMSAQMSDPERRKLADVVLENSGTVDDLRREVNARWEELIAT